MGYLVTDNTFDEKWPDVREVVQNLLYRRSVTKADWQHTFHAIFYLFSWIDDVAPKIRNALLEDVEVYVKECAQWVNASTNDEELLKLYIREWNHYLYQCSVIPMPFKCLEKEARDNVLKDNRLILPPHESHEKDAMLDIWLKYVFEPIERRLLNRALKLIDSERGNASVASELILGVRDSFVVLTTPEHYRDQYEKSYIQRMLYWYRDAAGQFIEHHGASSYIYYAEEKLQEEKARADRYLDLASKERASAACVTVLVTHFEEQLLVECEKMVKAEDIEGLRRLYHLVNRTATGFNAVLKLVADRVRLLGKEIMARHVVTTSTDPEQLINGLHLLFSTFSQLIKSAFDDDARALTARDQAFCDVVNDPSIFKLELPHSRKGKVTPESRCPEILANYCDLLLRKTPLSKRLTSNEVDTRLDSVMLILKYVQNKDVFMRYHKAHLARRLLTDISADQEKEETVVVRLRESGMPSDQVNKLCRMLGDVQLNTDLNQEYRKSLRAPANETADGQPNDTFSMKILGCASWRPGGNQGDSVKIAIPRQLEDFLVTAENFYKGKHSGRKLQWMHHWGNGTIIFNSDKGRYEIQLTTFHLAVLFCWLDNPEEGLSFEAIRLSTDLPDSELTRTLLSLCPMPASGDSQLLTCQSSASGSNPFCESTIFHLNTQYIPEKNGKPLRGRRVNLIGRLQLGLDASASSEHEEIVSLRALRVQEAIVKVMKTRKKLTASQLHTELVEHLRHMFLPSNQLMKEQLEWLIENKHIERCPVDINTFIYLD